MSKTRSHKARKRRGTYREINHQVGRALHQYGMIADGERIAVGLSGGKDSLVMMHALTERIRRIPIDYTLHAVYVDPGFPDGFSADLAAYCDQQGYDLRVIHTDDGIVAHSAENRENPCFLCSRRRRQRLFEAAEAMGCAKLALAHHKDDIIETFFLSICYSGEISTMRPFQPFFGGKITVIRPLCFVEEDVIRRFAITEKFPEFVNPCPTAGVSKRAEIKTLLRQLYRSNRKIKGNIFRSMQYVKEGSLLS